MALNKQHIPKLLANVEVLNWKTYEKIKTYKIIHNYQEIKFFY